MDEHRVASQLQQQAQQRPAFYRQQPRRANSDYEQSDILQTIRSSFATLTPANRKRILGDLLSECDIDQLVYVSNAIAPRLKRDFLRDLPVEIALHVLSFIDDPRTLIRASGVSRFWRIMLTDEYTWKAMCHKHNFGSGMRDAYRSVMEGSPTWEARRAIALRSPTLAITDALTSALETKMRLEDEGCSPDRQDTGGLSARATLGSRYSSSSFGTFGMGHMGGDVSAAGSSTGPGRLVADARRLSKTPAFKPRTLKLPTKVEEQFSFRKYFKLAYLSGKPIPTKGSSAGI